MNLNYSLSQLSSFRSSRVNQILSENSKRVRIVSNFSTQYLEWALVGHLKLDGRFPFYLDECYFDDFFTYLPDPKSLPDYLVVAVSLPLIKSSPFIASSNDPQKVYQYIVDRLNFFHQYDFKSILFILPELDIEAYTIFNEFSSWNHLYRQKLYSECISKGIVPVIIDDIFLTGTKPITTKFLLANSVAIDPYYIGSVAIRISMELINSLLPSTKVIAVDFDNTLWKGILAEDGLEDVALTHNYHTFQNFLLQCVSRGILLLGITKNEPSLVSNIFDVRDDFPLSSSSFYSIHAGWLPKASYLVSSLNDLNITTSGVVFIDDSTLEREEMKKSLPEIEVACVDFELDIVNQLIFNSYVRASSVSKEDRFRTQFYRENAKRSHYLDSSFSTADVNQKLGLSLHSFVISHSSDIQRCIQLINKTNQFNISTSRITDDLFNSLTALGHIFVGYKLYDSIGEYGLIAVVQIQLSELRIELFVMSCRAMGRKVESAILYDLQQRYSFSSFSLNYIKSPKNQILPSIFSDLGFDVSDQTFSANATLFDSEDKLYNIKLVAL